MPHLTPAQRQYIRKRTKVEDLDPSEMAGELNIIPFLDIVVNLIMFLLMTTTVVLAVVQIDTELPEYRTSPSYPPTSGPNGPGAFQFFVRNDPAGPSRFSNNPGALTALQQFIFLGQCIPQELNDEVYAVQHRSDPAVLGNAQLLSPGSGQGVTRESISGLSSQVW